MKCGVVARRERFAEKRPTAICSWGGDAREGNRAVERVVGERGSRRRKGGGVCAEKMQKSEYLR